MSESHCLDDDTLFTLVDEPETTGDASAHVAGCSSCAARKRDVERMLADLRGDAELRTADAFVERLTAKMREPSARKKSRARLVYGAATALALAAAVVLGPRLLDGGSFTARGGPIATDAPSQVELALDIVLRSPGGSLALIPASAGATMPRDAHLLLSYATRARTAKSFVLCFAVDGAGEIHWLYPAYQDVASNPSSVELEGGLDLRAMPTEALLDDVGPGSLHVFALVSKEPLHVGDVEPLAPSNLSRTDLAKRFPGVDVRTWDLTLGTTK